MAPTPSYTFKNIVVNIPNVRKPVPLFIVFRALGVISDKQIITSCLLDIEKYEHLVDLFIPSVHDSWRYSYPTYCVEIHSLSNKRKDYFTRTGNIGGLFVTSCR